MRALHLHSRSPAQHRIERLLLLTRRLKVSGFETAPKEVAPLTKVLHGTPQTAHGREISVAKKQYEGGKQIQSDKTDRTIVENGTRRRKARMTFERKEKEGEEELYTHRLTAPPPKTCRPQSDSL